MGLYTYFFEPVRWTQQYNCSFYSVEDVPLSKRQHPIYAIVVLSLFVIYELMYCPVLWAMTRKSVRSVFCYKLMLEMAIYDVLTLPLTALLPGIYSMNGWMFCSHPTLSYMAGGVIFPLWIGYSSTSLVLAINRCLAFSQYKSWFEGPVKQAFWILAPIVLTIVVLIFGQSITYNSILGAWFFNPHLGYFEDTHGVYPSTLQFWNNIIFCTVLPTVYIWFFLHNWAMSKKRMGGMSGKEYRLFTQCLMINLTICAAAAGYMLMQYLNLPTEFIAFSHVAWIIVEGAPPVVLLSMNETIRKIVFGRRGRNQTTQQHSTSNAPNANSSVPKLTDSQIIG